MDDVSVRTDSGLLDGLTEPQRVAVTHLDGPLLVLAGPGSGKTRVITRRVAYLIREVGIAPWNILAITFTNKAAGEMRGRVAELMSERQANAATITTFHSFCARLIRRHADRLGLPTSYSIYDSGDQQRCMKMVLEQLQISTSHFTPTGVLSTISNAKNDMVDAAAFAALAGDFYSKQVAKIYTAYADELKRNNALDFDDLLLRTAHLFRDEKDVLAEAREQYQYVLIDEYQDTNHAQFVIANALAREHQNICATGDPDQSIYRWRGADIRNILDFEKHYPDAKVVRLEQNYRSTKLILSVADRLIQRNLRRKHKALWTDNEAGEHVLLIRHGSEESEAQWIAEHLQRLHDERGMNWSDMAVFYRTNHLSRAVEDVLRHAGVPYQMARGTAFFERKEIKDAVAYLRAIVNPDDEVNLLRIINTPSRGISDRTVKALRAHAVAQGVSLGAALKDCEHVSGLGTRAVNSVRAFVSLLNAWRETIGIDDNALPPVMPENDGSITRDYELRGFVEQVLTESGLMHYYASDTSSPDNERTMNLGELVNSVQQYEMELARVTTQPLSLREKMEGFLERVALISDVDAVESDSGAVTLMTLHAAKGLEFGAVVMVGVEEGLLPHANSSDNVDEIEEERRLCFVGMTRARRELALSHVRSRMKFGRREAATASRFIGEIECEHTQLVDRADEDAFEDAGPMRMPRGGMTRDGEHIESGTLVRHPQFGIGKVLIMMPGRAKVQFEHYGVKTMVLEHARLERI